MFHFSPNEMLDCYFRILSVTGCEDGDGIQRHLYLARHDRQRLQRKPPVRPSRFVILRRDGAINVVQQGAAGQRTGGRRTKHLGAGGGGEHRADPWGRGSLRGDGVQRGRRGQHAASSTGWEFRSRISSP